MQHARWAAGTVGNSDKPVQTTAGSRGKALDSSHYIVSACGQPGFLVEILAKDNNADGFWNRMMPTFPKRIKQLFSGSLLHL